MRWRAPRRSENIEDRRRSTVASRPVAVGGVGGIGLLLVVGLALLMGVDPSEVLQGSLSAGGSEWSGPAEYIPSAEEERLGEFVSVVLADTEDTWGRIFEEAGRTYHDPTLVLYSGAVSSACGYAQAATGPFYCPADRKVYFDLDFFEALETRLGAEGDFAQAYVVAHEIGHHVQTELGIMQQVEELRSQSSRTDANRLLVMLELQADCLAGVWANRSQEYNLILDTSDIEEGLGAASAVGDDRLQMQSQGYVVPDAFTHGTSAQRVSWFRRGLETGEFDACNTFGAE